MAIRLVDVQNVRSYSSDVKTYGSYLMDSLNRVIGNIEGLKTRNIIEGEVADVLEQISADAYKEAQNFNVF